MTLVKTLFYKVDIQIVEYATLIENLTQEDATLAGVSNENISENINNTLYQWKV